MIAHDLIYKPHQLNRIYRRSSWIHDSCGPVDALGSQTDAKVLWTHTVMVKEP